MIPLRFLPAGLLFLSPFSFAQKAKPDLDHTLIILSTADIHGNLHQFPKLATVVKEYRAKYPHVLLVDSGDYFMGNPYVDDWEKPGKPMTILMNKLGYNLATIGNHDMDYGQQALRDHIKGTPKTTYVVTNLTPSPTLEQCFVPYASIPVKNTSISVGFLGLANMQTTDVVKMDGVSWKMPNGKDYGKITEQFRLLNNNINIVISHMGYDQDQVMMKYSPNIDIILGGHTHVTLPNGLLKYGTLLSHTGARLQRVGVTKVVFSADQRPAVLSKSTETVILDQNIPNDPEFEKLVAQFTNNPSFTKQVATVKEKIAHSAIGVYFCKAIQQAATADLAIYNRGGIRAKTNLPQGPLTIKDIYEMEPFRDMIVTCRMNKADIEMLLLTKFLEPANDDGDMLEVYCSGFAYQITDGATPSITSTLKNGVIYTVAMCDYLCNNFEFPQKGEGKPTGKSVRTALINYFSALKEITNPPPSKPQIIRKTQFSL